MLRFDKQMTFSQLYIPFKFLLLKNCENIMYILSGESKGAINGLETKEKILSDLKGFREAGFRDWR